MKTRPILILLCFGLMAAMSLAAAVSASGPDVTPGAGPTLPNPILFVTQPPIRQDFTTIGSTFGNHLAGIQEVGRGGDLWIRYPDGSLKNLTAAAGYGSIAADGFQGANAIAVRDPAVHWDGSKAVFSMVIGAPTRQYELGTYFWQLYEITGLGPNDTPVISKVPNQPANFNNVQPIYGSDDRIIFVSDRPRNGAAHLYPQRDEYELAPTNTGLWSLDPAGGDPSPGSEQALRLLNHAPSGDFTPLLDSFGRIVFTQWDHLQRDQQADADANYGTGQNCDSGNRYGTFNYASEAANAAYNLNNRAEIFPEPRPCRGDLLAGTNLAGHSFNHFFPWTLLEDGSNSEVLAHLGRHELHGYIPASITGDPNIIDFYGQLTRFNPRSIQNFFHIAEDPTTPGRYYGIDAPEFGTHGSGQVVRLDAPPSADADHITVTYVSHRDTFGTSATPNHSGRYRDPLALADGRLIASHTTTTGEENGSGSPLNSNYSFRLKMLSQGGNGYWAADQSLTPGIVKTLRYWSPDVEVTYTGPLWELNAVEVRPRARPARLQETLPGPEQQIFAQAGVALADLQAYLRANDLALLVTRDATTRDDFDRQQPFNLRVASGNHQSTGAAGTIYDIAFLQIFQGDQLRGWTGCCGSQPLPGRRVLAQFLHDPAAVAANPALPGAAAAGFAIAADGSAAAFVPARRALTWQLTDAQGVGVVRERYWVSFQPGEIRVCSSCHGLSQFDQAGRTAPTNPPQALLQLLTHWRDHNAGQPTSTPTPTPQASPTRTPTATPTRPPASGSPQIAGCDVFPADNIWNTAVDGLPLDPNSAAYINTIGPNRTLKADFGSGLWEGGPIGIPFTTVPGSQARVNVSFDYASESDPGPYPIPPNPPIEGGPNSTGDRHVLVLDRDNCVLYELYAAYPQADGSWQAGSGAIFDLESHALRPEGWTSADAAGLPIVPGLVRYEEVLSGEIRHAIRFTAPQTRRAYVWPGRHHASSLTGTEYPPMGQRFRLKANYDISGFAPEVQVILRALKKYGLILADNGSAWYISGAPDERWDNDMLRQLQQMPGSALEAVESSSLMVDRNSGQARSGPGPTSTPTATRAASATPTRTPSPTLRASPTRTPTRTPTPGAAGISGVVRAEGSGLPLTGIRVTAYQRTSSGWAQLVTTTTKSTGGYLLANLTPGTYRLRFRDRNGVYKTEFYNNVATLGRGTDITVTAGRVTGGIDAALALAP